eukprot:6857-Heterococcus_DN1.PRE.2
MHALFVLSKFKLPLLEPCVTPKNCQAISLFLTTCIETQHQRPCRLILARRRCIQQWRLSRFAFRKKNMRSTACPRPCIALADRVLGSLSAVLGFPLGRSTLGSKISEGDHGRITVQLANSTKPTSEAMLQVQELVSDTIAKMHMRPMSMSRQHADEQAIACCFVWHCCLLQDLPCYTVNMLRSEAEALYGECMYDNFEVPAEVTELSMVYIQGLSLHATPNKCLPSTKAVGSIQITKEKFRASKCELEVMFDVIAPTTTAAAEVQSCAAPAADVIKPLQSSVPRHGTAATGNSADCDNVVVSSSSDGAAVDAGTASNGQYCSSAAAALNVTPWEVEAEEEIDYGKLVRTFGSQLIDEDMVSRVERLTNQSDLPLDETHRLAYENARDIIACGFDPTKTFVFSDLDYIGSMYPVILKIQKFVTFNQTRGIFGFNDSTNIGCIAFPAVQAAPAFPASFPTVLKGQTKMPCLIPCAIDQDAYFRMTRDVAPRLSKFFPGLQGPKGKMSSSAENTAIFVTDTPKQIKKKIQGSFSGGQDTKELQLLHGANLHVDVAYQYLGFFLEDDAELKQIGDDYSSGKMLTGDVKAKLTAVLTTLVQQHQERRAAVTDEVLQQFLAVRPLDF